MRKNIIRDNFEGATNVLMITRNKLKDRDIVLNGDVGKVFYLEVEKETKDLKNKAKDSIVVCQMSLISLNLQLIISGKI